MQDEIQESYYDYMGRRNKEEDAKLLFDKVNNGQVFTVQVVEDDNGELALPIPTELLNQMGWDIGDNLIWEDSFGNSFIIKKAP
mgnify:FL=1|jgi:hypothetical protein|tara:strand:- start:37 stop:288 length:252 start_codon:yes stop_codon:yes gene_type:complete